MSAAGAVVHSTVELVQVNGFHLDVVSSGDRDYTSVSESAVEKVSDGLFETACTSVMGGGCGAVTLTVAADRVVHAGVAYVLRFKVVNPFLAQQSPTVSTAVEGPAPIQQAAVARSTADCAGVRQGCMPLRVVVPGWMWLG